MSTTSELTVPLETEVKTEVVTTELHIIIKAISELDGWQSIFRDHCHRTGKPAIPPNQVILDHDLGERTYTYTTTWQGRSYQSYTYDNLNAAHESLYQELVASVMKDELAKVNQWPPSTITQKKPLPGVSRRDNSSRHSPSFINTTYWKLCDLYSKPIPVLYIHRTLWATHRRWNLY